MVGIGKSATFVVTFYCACAGICTQGLGLTAAGVRPREGWTIACDPRVLPIGSIVSIEGFGERMCQDTGSAIKGRHIDIFVDEHGRARRLGRQRLRVRVIHRPGEPPLRCEAAAVGPRCQPAAPDGADPAPEPAALGEPRSS